MKYLIILSKSFSPRDSEARIDTTKAGDENEGLGKIVNGKVQQPPEPAFKRLHILYLIHDLLVYFQRHQGLGTPLRIAEQLYPDVCVLAQLAACGADGKASRTCPLVLDLINFWQQSQIFTSEQIEKLRSRVSQADETAWPTILTKLSKVEDSRTASTQGQLDDGAKWTLPDRHGVINDPNAPWHELPAANGLYVRRKRGYPLRASAIPPSGFKLAHGGQEASADLKRDVLNLYNEVLRCYDKYTNPDEVQDVDALGNIIWKDPERPTRNYWGFTLEGIERKRELAVKFEEAAVGYDGFGQQGRVNEAVQRAQMLASARARGMGGRGGMGRGGGGWRGGRGW